MGKLEATEQDHFPQSHHSFAEIDDIIYKHLEERDWLARSSRSIATSVALEAAELLEHYQWSETPVGTKQDLGDELADVLIYAFQFAQLEEIDIAAAIQRKLEKAAVKYPASAFKNKSKEEKHEAWLNAKLKHHKNGL